ncbi:MAG: hypothetical protein SFV18_01525 [Bryobacteraceae bacterium]|nr:hypothetical protein [Bryobacteraceae bacterium]
MVRLIAHTRERPYEARSFSALVHVLRFCGLLVESVAAYRRALELDRTLQTSVPHTFFNLCDYAGVIDTYSGATQIRGYLDLAAWAALGHERRAATLARERLSTKSLAPLLETLVESLLATIEGDRDKVIATAARLPAANDPETMLYCARHLSRCGLVERGIELLRAVVANGYGCGVMLANDPWFSPLREREEFRRIRAAAGAAENKARRMFREAGGSLVLPGVAEI